MAFKTILYLKIRDRLPNEELPYLRPAKHKINVDAERKVLISCIRPYTQLHNIFVQSSLKEIIWRIVTKKFNVKMREIHPDQIVSRGEEYLKRKFNSMTIEYRNAALQNKTYYIQSELEFLNIWIFNDDKVLFDSKTSRKVVDNAFDYKKEFTKQQYEQFVKERLDLMAHINFDGENNGNEIENSNEKLMIESASNTLYMNEFIGHSPKYFHCSNNAEDELLKIETELGIIKTKETTKKTNESPETIDLSLATPEKIALVNVILSMNNEDVVKILEKVNSHDEGEGSKMN